MDLRFTGLQSQPLPQEEGRGRRLRLKEAGEEEEEQLEASLELEHQVRPAFPEVVREEREDGAAEVEEKEEGEAVLVTSRARMAELPPEESPHSLPLRGCRLTSKASRL